jgi:cytochrome c oxidase subunit 3
LLSIIFVYFQFKGWQELTLQGVYLTGEGSNVAGSFLYVLTLAHLVHLIGGIIAIIFAIYFSFKNIYSRDNMLGFKLISTYWHFLGVLWIFLYLFLKYKQEGSISFVFNNILSQKNYICNLIFTV